MRRDAIQLDRRFQKRARGRFEKYEFEVGVLADRVYRKPGKGTKSFAGGPSRKIGRKTSGMTISEVSESLRENTGVNIYTKPFQSRKNKDILRFSESFFKLVSNDDGKKRTRAENLLQAIVRNPILRGDYGTNTEVTAKIKGFNRFMIDTGQLFRNIVAKTRVKNV